MTTYTIDENVAQYIVDKVTSSQGIKSTELVVNLVSQFYMCDKDTIERVLLNLIKDGKIIEIEYHLPLMPYRSKSFFLPAGTKIQVVVP